jgi:hypothetical protein
VKTEKKTAPEIGDESFDSASCTLKQGNAIPLSNFTPPINVAIKFRVTIEENYNLNFV